MRYHLGILATMALFGSSCDYNKPGDYDPKADFKSYQAQQASQAKAGSVSQIDPKIAMMTQAKKNYNLYCGSCHGADGGASTPTAMALSPKPRDFKDKGWQKQVDDARIAKVIKEGGASVGLSPSMAPWGATLSDEDIQALVTIIRDFAK